MLLDSVELLTYLSQQPVHDWVTMMGAPWGGLRAVGGQSDSSAVARGAKSQACRRNLNARRRVHFALPALRTLSARRLDKNPAHDADAIRTFLLVNGALACANFGFGARVVRIPAFASRLARSRDRALPWTSSSDGIARGRDGTCQRHDGDSENKCYVAGTVGAQCPHRPAQISAQAAREAAGGGNRGNREHRPRAFALDDHHLACESLT